MQTFLPYESFVESAMCLDRQRLGKQRVEALQILRTLRGESSGWSNHPAVRMWRGYEEALIAYGLQVCVEWTDRGYSDTCFSKIVQLRDDSGESLFGDAASPRPPWLGDPGFHLSHQSNLVRKDPGHYGPLFPGVPDDLPYVWPA